jgi:hypothetical protein
MRHTVFVPQPEQQRENRHEIHQFRTCSVLIDLGERVFSVTFNPSELTRRDWNRAMRLRRGYPTGPDATLASEVDGYQTWEAHF